MCFSVNFAKFQRKPFLYLVYIITFLSILYFGFGQLSFNLQIYTEMK